MISIFNLNLPIRAIIMPCVGQIGLSLQKFQSILYHKNRRKKHNKKEKLTLLDIIFVKKFVKNEMKFE